MDRELEVLLSAPSILDSDDTAKELRELCGIMWSHLTTEQRSDVFHDMGMDGSWEQLVEGIR